jgi:hypothetical protein
MYWEKEELDRENLKEEEISGTKCKDGVQLICDMS